MESKMDLKATELTLGLPGGDSAEPRGSKRMAEAAEDAGAKTGRAAPVKAQVVGWPPVRSFRRNAVMANKTAAEQESGGGMYVKVSMDGAPYLRKIDLKAYQGYKELLSALENIFKCFNLGEFPGKQESSNKSDYALTYEDKDGDWMLVGDVPFEMFISSCKRLRIMKGSEARGLGSSL